MMKIDLSIQTLGVIFLLFHHSISHADLHGTLTLTTDNIGRWFSKSDHGPAIQANIDYQHHSGLFLGGSVSTIHYVTPEQSSTAQVEAIPYIGWTYKFTEQWRLDTQWSRYLFNGSLFNQQTDYDEFYLFLHYKDMFTGRVSASPDYYALGNYALDYELTGRYSITDSLEFSAGFGYAQTNAVLGSDYPYWNAGLSYYYKFIALDLRYRDATETNLNSAVAERMHERYNPPLISATCVFSVSMGF